MTKKKGSNRAADDGLLVSEDYETLPAESDHEPSEGVGPADGSLAEQRVVGFPYASEEEVGMKMQPVVVGPPAYGSPDPTTAAGRLINLRDHPLADQISEDYGADVEGGTVALGEEGTHHGAPSGTDLDRAARGEGAGAEGYEGMKVPELKSLAKERGITGYSQMGKEDLVALHEEWDATPPEERAEAFGSEPAND